jgi:D-glycero-D-manno-heptose 1,7-bisphosphate phosphatase
MNTPQSPLIILDRDGVINHDSDDYIKSPEEWRPIDQSLEAISKLKHAGWVVVVATNQSGVERGLFDINTLHAIHNKMMAAVTEKGGHIDSVFFCPHAPASGCDCRKPASGLLKDIAQRFGIPLNNVPVVGDSLRDLQAGAELGCSLWLVKTGKGERTLAAAKTDPSKALPANTRVADNLANVVNQLLAERKTLSA